MPAPQSKPWSQTWTRGAQIGKGGLGLVYRVQKTADTSVIAVLKLLKIQNSAERRSRMHREVTALQTLDHAGIPKVLDANTELYADATQELYFVSDFIDGPTVEKMVESGPIGFGDALSLLDRLIEIIAYVHAANIVHRDIKPDNVILRAGNVKDPVLFDFGQSFNIDPVAGSETFTPSDQDLGNRFMFLPELSHGSGLQRDIRSDLAQACGVFFFALTGKVPGHPVDARKRPPHKREAAALKPAVPDNKLHLVNQFFDMAFQVELSQRFQSAAAIRKSIQTLLDLSVSPSTDAVSHRIKGLLEELDGSLLISRSERILAIFREADKTVNEAFETVQSASRGRFNRKQSGYSPDPVKGTWGNSLGLFLPADPSREFFPMFWAEIKGEELVIVSKHKGTEKELLRAPAFGLIDWERFKANVVEVYVEGLTETFKGIG